MRLAITRRMCELGNVLIQALSTKFQGSNVVISNKNKGYSTKDLSITLKLLVSTFIRINLDTYFYVAP